MQGLITRACCRRLALAALLSIAIASAVEAARLERDGLTYDGIPEPDAALTDALAPFTQSRAARLLDWMADGSLLIASRADETEQLYRVRTPLGDREPLVGGDDAVLAASAPAYASDTVAVLRQVVGAYPRLQLVTPQTQEARPVLEPSWRPDAPLWAHDGKRLAFTSPVRNGRSRDVYIIDTGADSQPELVASGDGDWQVLDWSRDDRELLLLQRLADGTQQLLRLEMATATQRVVMVANAGARITQASLAADGRGVLALTDQGGEFLRLVYLSPDASSGRPLSPVMAHDVTQFTFSGDGRLIAYLYDEYGQSRLALLDQRAGQEKILPRLPGTLISALRFDRAGTRLALNIENPIAPADVYVLDLASNALVRWTESNAGPLRPAQLSAPQAFRYRTWDRETNGRQREFAGLLYRPQTPRSAGAARLPVLIWLPGGDGEVRSGFDPSLQALVNALGFAVVAPTVRGSGGGGRAFLELGNGDGRDDAVRDVGALLVWLGLQPDLDRNRIALRGAGGNAYVALAAVARFSERLQSAVIVDGAPLSAQLSAVPRPTLIIRGVESDPASAGAADQLMWRLRAARNQTWLLAGEGEKGAWNGMSQRAELLRVTAQFLRDTDSGASAVSGQAAP